MVLQEQARDHVAASYAGCVLTEQSRRRFLSRTRVAPLCWAGRLHFQSWGGRKWGADSLAHGALLWASPAQPPPSKGSKQKVEGGRGAGEVAVSSRNWFRLLQLGEQRRSAAGAAPDRMGTPRALKRAANVTAATWALLWHGKGVFSESPGVRSARRTSLVPKTLLWDWGAKPEAESLCPGRLSTSLETHLPQDRRPSTPFPVSPGGPGADGCSGQERGPVGVGWLARRGHRQLLPEAS